MTVKSKSLLLVLVLVLTAGMMVGCGCSPTSKGAHAFAQKAGGEEQPPKDVFDDTRPTGEIPLTQYPGAEGLCQRIHFDYDKSNIKPEWTDCLDRIAAFIVQHPNLILIVEGHCDERGSNEYNMALGERRAMSTKDYLAQRGVKVQMINTRSKGEEMPLADCHNESCWWQNRRAEFYVLETAR
ncbi:MAG: OmpA family protein [bacterium]|nr:OmpA family protein [bacterium]